MAPIIAAAVMGTFFSPRSFLLLSLIDVKSKKVFRIALCFGSNPKNKLFIDLDYNPQEMKKSFEKLSEFNLKNTTQQLELFRDIIEGKHQLRLY